jgi:hypothetical protein
MLEIKCNRLCVLGEGCDRNKEVDVILRKTYTFKIVN